MELIHATCVLYGGAGLLLRGPSGAGKSDLGLRLIRDGGHLVGDDYIWAGVENGRLYAAAPQTIAGRIEVRGLGIVECPGMRTAEIHAAIDLVSSAAIERLPEARTEIVVGQALPAFFLDPFESSAMAKVAAIAEVCKNPARRGHGRRVEHIDRGRG